MAAIEKICPEAKNLLLIPEKHTRNTFYLMNVARLMRDLPPGRAERAPRHARRDDHRADRSCRCPTAASSRVEPLVRTRDRLGLKDFDPCTILLNNDLSAGHAAGSSRTCTSSTCCRRCTPAGRCGARRNHFHSLRGGGQEVRQAARHGPVADQPDVRALRRGRTSPTASGVECLQSNVEALLGQDPPQVQGIRHQGEAVRHRQGRHRHLRHGHHDRARPEGPRRPEPRARATR